jgi:hypothetical protein
VDPVLWDAVLGWQVVLWSAWFPPLVVPPSIGTYKSE